MQAQAESGPTELSPLEGPEVFLFSTLFFFVHFGRGDRGPPRLAQNDTREAQIHTIWVVHGLDPWPQFKKKTEIGAGEGKDKAKFGASHPLSPPPCQ